MTTVASSKENDNDNNDNRMVSRVDAKKRQTGAELLRSTYCLAVLLCYLLYLAYYSQGELLPTLKKILIVTAIYAISHAAYYYLDIHKRFGIWKCSEPASHYRFAMHSSWVVALFTVGEITRKIFYSMDAASIGEAVKERVVAWEVAEEYKIIRSENTQQDIFWGIIGFYVSDFLRYWAHRIGHYSFFYKTFPFSHAHHHNQIFITPFITLMSPLLHLASLATYTPPFLLGIQGLHRAAFISLLIAAVPNWTQHLGCDPFPWLTRWNHYYFYGALPWIPLYHSYHHNPFIKTGNFGNTTVLFDYVFGTVQPESVYHIENGRPLEKVAQWFENEERLDRVLKSMYESNGGKHRLDFNEKGFDFSKEMLSMNVL